MIYIQVDKIDDNKGVVGLIHYQPEKLPDEMLARGFLVESLPTVDPTKIGMKAISYYYYDLKTVMIDYIEDPRDRNEGKIKNLEDQVAYLTDMLDKVLAAQANK